MKVFVLINAASGSCNAEDEAKVGELAARHAYEVVGSWCGNGEGLGEAYRAVQHTSPDTLIVLGGDGTIRSAIENCRGRVTNFILLPGGTMNLLVRAIYGEKTWQQVLEDVLKNPTEKTIASGRAGDKEFFVAAILGTPSLLAHTREALRAGDVGAAVTHGASVLATPFISFAYEANTTGGIAETLLITTPLVSDVLRNEDRALDIAAVSIPGAFETLRILSAAALGMWRADENVTTHAARKVHINAPEPIPATLDGEPVELAQEVSVEFVPHALTVLVPKT